VICPSYPRAAARLEIGCKSAAGSVEFHETPIQLRPTKKAGAAQFDLALQDSSRYAGPCVSSSCSNWSDGCQLGRRIALLGHEDGEACAIAENCRWFAENGASACNTCKMITYSM